ncbi:MAG: response regulator [Leptospiraceae bacterium]|nr:response regulator [Leptospiraceae bacterium]MCP5512209.1 response regulator [Leptospiraceae bacterium]
MNFTVRTRMFIISSILVILICSISGYLNYKSRSEEYTRGIDKTLFTSAVSSHEFLPPDYHSRILNQNSITNDTYNEIVERHNRICKKIGLQYIWSVIVLSPDKIYFTTATSPEKDIRKNDHAKFFDLHSDPNSFSSVLGKTKPVYSSFENKWGSGRSVLIPYYDKSGRQYIMGASISTEEIKIRLKEDLSISIAIYIIFLTLGLFLSYVFSYSLTKSFQEFIRSAEDISSGNFQKHKTIRYSGSDLRQLSKAFDRMRRIIQHREYLLQKNNLKLTLLLNDQEKLVEERTLELKIQKEKAEEASRVKSEFLGRINHELRTPMQTALSSVELIGSDSKALEHLRSSLSQTVILIEEMLDFVKYEYNSSNLNICFSLEKGIKEIIDVYKPNTTVQLNYQIMKSIPKYFYGDPKKLFDIIRNLLSNAIKWTKEGEIFFDLNWSEENHTLRGSVRDTGPGIPDGQEEILFDAFTQLQPENRSIKGIGLGLHIARKAARDLGGDLWVEKDYHEGAGFIFTVKLDSCTNWIESKQVCMKKNECLYHKNDLLQLNNLDNLLEMKYLIVDDEEINLYLFKDLLNSKGFKNLLTAENGQDAIDLALSESPDIIFLDINLPDISGFDVNSKLKELNCTSEVIAFTGDATSEVFEKCNQEGIRYILKKPAKLNNILDTLEKFLDSKTEITIN